MHDEKLLELYKECINELKSVNIDILNNKALGDIAIKIAPRNAKRYGCCKQEEPDISSKYIIKKGRKKFIHYSRFKKHTIEISKWVMELDNSIIKNTIMHELIHCFPECSNHGVMFKKYAKYINETLGYNITRLGNKEEDFKKSNLEYNDNNTYKYKIVCKDCNTIFYRKRIRKDLLCKYRCGKCGGKLKIV